MDEALRGRMWVAADDYQLVKIDMRAFDDISIGWGVVGRVNKGSRVLYLRRRSFRLAAGGSDL